MIALIVFECLLYVLLGYLAYRFVVYMLFPKGISEIKELRKTKAKYKVELEGKKKKKK